MGEAWESWATFYILTPFAFSICHIILFPVVLRSTDHGKQSEHYFILYALCCIGKKCDKKNVLLTQLSEAVGRLGPCSGRLRPCLGELGNIEYVGTDASNVGELGHDPCPITITRVSARNV